MELSSLVPQIFSCNFSFFLTFSHPEQIARSRDPTSDRQACRERDTRLVQPDVSQGARSVGQGHGLFLSLTVPPRPIFPAILRVHEPAALPMPLLRRRGSGSPASVVLAGSVASRVTAIVGPAVDALHHERQERRAAGAARQHGHLDLVVAYHVIDPEPQQLPDSNECRNGGNRGQGEGNTGVAPGRG